MQIKQLFKELKNISTDTEEIFDNSGMLNEFDILDYGFFPLGSGILTENSNTEEAEIEEGGIMILGNDFGTKSYVDKECKDKREGNSPTIRNLQSKLSIDNKNTFYTNFYLGLRDDQTYPGTTNIQRIKSIQEDYKSFCHSFFLTQLRLIKPKVIICLGHAVRLAIAENFEQISHWKYKSASFKKLYADDRYYFDIELKEFGKMKFIVIPHPCDTRNFNIYYIQKINGTLNKASIE